MLKIAYATYEALKFYACFRDLSIITKFNTTSLKGSWKEGQKKGRKAGWEEGRKREIEGRREAEKEEGGTIKTCWNTDGYQNHIQ